MCRAHAFVCVHADVWREDGNVNAGSDVAVMRGEVLVIVPKGMQSID